MSSNIFNGCNPDNTKLWFNNNLPKNLDPVLSNIYNGCWQCNFRESVVNNDILLNRRFYDGFIIPPYKNIIDIDSKMRINNNNRSNYYYNNK